MRNMAERPAGRVGTVALAVIVAILAGAGCARSVSESRSLKDSPGDHRAARVVKASVVRDTHTHRVVRRDADATRAALVAPVATQARPAAPQPEGGAYATASGGSVAATTAMATDARCLTQSECRDRIAELAADAGVAWLHTAPGLTDDMSGARFLAIRRVRAKLTCAELELARGSIAGSQERLGLVVRRAPDQAAQADAAGALHLAGAVLTEVAKEQGRRCNAPN